MAPGTRVVKRRYKEFPDIKVTELKGWGHVEHARQLRNALTHNLGLYTSPYVKTKLSYRPTREELHGLDPTDNDDRLINRVPTPLSSKSVDQLLTHLIEVAGEVRDALRRVGRA